MMNQEGFSWKQVEYTERQTSDAWKRRSSADVLLRSHTVFLVYLAVFLWQRSGAWNSDSDAATQTESDEEDGNTEDEFAQLAIAEKIEKRRTARADRKK